MKKIAFVIVIIVAFISYTIGEGNRDLEVNEQIEKIESQTIEIQNLNDKNTELKKELNKFICGDSKRDIVQMGSWLDPQKGDLKCIMKLFKNDKTKKIYMHLKYGDDSETTDEMRISEYKGLKRYELYDNIHNEFYVVEKNGDLSMYGQSGKFRTIMPF